MQALIALLATADGLFLAWMDSRPGWDDTAVTVGAVLLSAGFWALLSGRRPWLIALLVGAWLPLYEVTTSGQYASLAALVVAFAGAYAGWGVRRTAAKVAQPG